MVQDQLPQDCYGPCQGTNCNWFQDSTGEHMNHDAVGQLWGCCYTRGSNEHVYRRQRTTGSTTPKSICKLVHDNCSSLRVCVLLSQSLQSSGPQAGDRWLIFPQCEQLMIGRSGQWVALDLAVRIHWSDARMMEPVQLNWRCRCLHAWCQAGSGRYLEMCLFTPSQWNESAWNNDNEVNTESNKTISLGQYDHGGLTN